MEEEDLPPIPPTLNEMFVAYGMLDPNNGGQLILLAQSDHWMKHARIFKIYKNLSLTDTGVAFFKFRKQKLNYQEFLEFLALLCANKNFSLKEIKHLLTNCGPPNRRNNDV